MPQTTERDALFIICRGASSEDAPTNQSLLDRCLREVAFSGRTLPALTILVFASALFSFKALLLGHDLLFTDITYSGIPYMSSTLISWGVSVAVVGCLLGLTEKLLRSLALVVGGKAARRLADHPSATRTLAMATIFVIAAVTAYVGVHYITSMFDFVIWTLDRLYWLWSIS